MVKPFAAEGAESGLIMNKGTESLEALYIPFAIEPEAQVSSFGIFFVQMVQATLIQGIKIGVREHFAAIGHGSLNDSKGFNLPIGFCNMA